MDFLTKEHIIFNEHLSTKNEVIEMIADQAVSLGIAADKSGLIKSFLAREQLGTTGFGNGLAIPHAKSEYVKQVAVIIVKSTVPIEWDAIDGSPVQVAIALLVPEENAGNIHLKVLSSISRKLVNEEFKKQLFEAQTAEQLYDLFQGVLTAES